MRRSRSQAAIAAIVATLVATGCSIIDDGGSGPEGRWLVTAIAGNANAGPTTTFELAADGAVAGKGGCNSYFGSATIDGDAISFGPLGATQMACAPELMDREAAFFAALESVVAWRAAEDQLVLLDAAGAEAVRLRAMNETAAIAIDVPDTSGAAQRLAVRYDCGGVAVEVEYIDAGDVSLATLAIGDAFVVASRVLAASGARYSGGQYVWWNKGDEATLIDYMNGGSDAAVACRQAG
jgi:heat shock protein HslJ